MGPTLNLAPLLVELGAVVPGRGFYFVISQMDRLDEIVQTAADRYISAFQRMGRIACITGRRQQASIGGIRRDQQ
jgi:FMN reductase